MKLKNIIQIVFVIFTNQNLTAQTRTIGLKECIQLALANKSSILALKTNATIDSLNSIQLKAKYFPEVALVYDYLYNPIIRTNIVPTGKFSPVPTDEVRPIKFGTSFNQSAGLQILQPIFDASIKSRIAETTLQVKIKQAEIKTANEDLAFEVAQSFSKLLLKQKQLKEIEFDTLRTAKTLSFSNDRFLEGKVLKTEVNKTQINHNNAVFSLQELLSSLVVEKIFLGFLINIPANEFDVADADNLFNQTNLALIDESTNVNSLALIQEYDTKVDLVKLQLKNEKVKYLPTLSAKGYAGADQFSNQLNPFQSNSWFGNAFVGLSARLPLLIGENKKNKQGQYQAQILGLNLQKEEVIKNAAFKKQTAKQEIAKLQAEYNFHKSNVLLYKENLIIYQERLQAGQETVNTINLEEIVYLKETEQLNIVDSKVWQYWLTYLKNAGLLFRITQ